MYLSCGATMCCVFELWRDTACKGMGLPELDHQTAVLVKLFSNGRISPVRRRNVIFIDYYVSVRVLSKKCAKRKGC
jgi:hypothetical protein